MLSATNHDGPAFHARSGTAQSNKTKNLTPKPETDTATLHITNVTETLDAMLKPLTEDR